MRTIKFRGKCCHSDAWVFGDLEVNRLDERTLIHTYYDDKRYHCQCDVRADTVGQFTGLYDKNGKEIYEGDILKAGDFGVLEVRFVRGVFAFLWDGNLDDESPTGSPTHEWAEVIGNIHDNSDLMKGGEE